VVGLPRPVDPAEDDPRRPPRQGRLVARFDDELWELVPDDPGPAAPQLVAFVRSLGERGDVLDLGCGDGRLTAELRGRSLTGADVSEVALDRARLRVPEATLVRVAPDEPLPFGDAAFDLVLCAETIEHVRDVQLLVSEVRRVLRPGGTFAVTTPAHTRLTALRVLARGWEREFEPLSAHLRYFTARSLRGLLDEMGFDVAAVETRAGSLLSLASRP
jgi:SAM-dependent methyltransferase